MQSRDLLHLVGMVKVGDVQTAKGAGTSKIQPQNGCNRK